MAACACLACAVSANAETLFDPARLIILGALALLCIPKRLRLIFIPALCTFVLFCGLYLLRDARPKDLPTGKFPLRGTIAGEPMDQTDKHRTVLTLENCVIDQRAVDYQIRIYVYKNGLGYEVGDELSFAPAKLTLPSGVTNPDGFDFNAYLWRSGTALTASANAKDITLIQKHPTLKRGLLRVRRSLSLVSDEIFGDTSDVMKAVLLGDRSSLSGNTYDDFSASGISHLIALSGLHVSALALMIEFLLKKLRIPRAARYAVTIVFLILYTIMTGASPSTVRAVFMYAILCITRILGYYSDTLTRLCMALLIQLGINPLLIGDNGFILSYTSVAAILCFADMYVLTGDTKHRLLKSWLLSAKTSFSVQLIGFPLLAGMFYSVPLLSVPVNVLCVPLAVLALYAGVVVLLIGTIHAPIALILAVPVKLIWRFIKLLSAWVAKLPFAGVMAAGWPIALAVPFIAVTVFSSVYMTGSKKRMALGALALVGLIVISLIPPRPIDHLRVTFLSVGESDSAVFDAQGSVYVVDCGKDNGITADYLTAHRANVKGVFLTHADADHYGGSTDILARYPEAIVYMPACWESMDGADEAALLFQGHQIVHLKKGDQVRLSRDVRADVLWPEEDFYAKEDNDGSLIVNISYHDYSLLMMGDLSDKYELAACTDADMIKIAHHGSKHSTTSEMLQAVTPSIAVISVGNNGYGHPAPEVIDRLNAIGAGILRTDESGAVTIDIYADGQYEINTVLQTED